MSAPGPLSALILWGLPSWSSLFLVVLVGQYYRKLRARKRELISRVYATLWEVESAELQKRLSHRQVGFQQTQGLIRWARMLIALCVPALPWLPALLGVYVLWPYATLAIPTNGQGFPKRLRRQRLHFLRKQIFRVALLSAFLFAPWLCAFAGAKVNGNEGPGVLLLWVFLVIETISNAGCIRRSGATGSLFSLSQESPCLAKFNVVASIAVVQAACLLLLANASMCFLLQLGQERALRDVFSGHHRRARPITAVLCAGACFSLVLPCAGLAARALLSGQENAGQLDTFWVYWLGAVMPICFSGVVPVLCGLWVHVCQPPERDENGQATPRDVFDELYGLSKPVEQGAGTAAEDSAQLVGSLSSGPSSRGGPTRFMGEFRDLVVGLPEAAATGLCEFIQANEQQVHKELARGTACVVDEWKKAADNGFASESDLDNLWYVLDGEAGSGDKFQLHSLGWKRDCDPETGDLLPEREREGGTPMRLQDFVDHPSARQARLTENHVLALRLYTTSAFRNINSPLRQLEHGHVAGAAASPRLQRPHPLPCTLFLIYDGLKKLRAASRSQSSDPNHSDRPDGPARPRHATNPGRRHASTGARAPIYPSCKARSDEDMIGVELADALPPVSSKGAIPPASSQGDDSTDANLGQQTNVLAAVQNRWPLWRQLHWRLASITRSVLGKAAPGDDVPLGIGLERRRGSMPSVELWRGMRDVRATDSFLQHGGCEVNFASLLDPLPAFSRLFVLSR